MRQMLIASWYVFKKTRHESINNHLLIIFNFLPASGQTHDRTNAENQQIIMADQAKITGLANTLKRLKNGEIEYDFFWIDK